MVISSNSDQAALIGNALLATAASQPGHQFQNIGDLLATPQLTEQSPYLNLSTVARQRYGVSDLAYEAIPSQLLPCLRVDPVGQLTATNGQLQLQFTGYDGHAYAIQVSSNLSTWTSISTNSPVNGAFSTPLTETNNGTQFLPGGFGSIKTERCRNLLAAKAGPLGSGTFFITLKLPDTPPMARVNWASNY